MPRGATICVHPLIRLLHVLLVSMLVLFFALHWMIVKNGHYFHILLVISALLWRPAQRAESFMESSLGSNFKSWSRPLTFLNIFTAQLKIVSPNIIRQQTIWHNPTKIGQQFKRGSKKARRFGKQVWNSDPCNVRQCFWMSLIIFPAQLLMMYFFYSSLNSSFLIRISWSIYVRRGLFWMINVM